MVVGEPVLIGTQVEGVVLAVASLQPIRAITKGSGGGVFEVYVVDNRGRLIAHSDPNRPLAENMSTIEIVRLFLEQSGRNPGGAAAGRRSAAGGFGTTRFAMRGEDGVEHQMLGTSMPVPDESGLGRRGPGRHREGLLHGDRPQEEVHAPGGARDRARDRARNAVRRRDQPADPEARRGRPPPRRRRLRHARERDEPQRGRGPRGRLQPDGGGDPEGDRGDPPARRGERGAVHGVDPHARQRDRREGPLHARPLGARRLLLRVRREAPGHAARARWAASTSRA